MKAARALAGVDQQQVADAAGVNVNTIRNMEARGAKPITSSAVTVRRVQLVLEALGIEFLNHAQPGVRLSIQEPAPRKSGGRTSSFQAVANPPKATKTIGVLPEIRSINPRQRASAHFKEGFRRCRAQPPS